MSDCDDCDPLNLTDDDLKDIEDAIRDTDVGPQDTTDKTQVTKYNERREEIARFKKELSDIENMEDKDWAKLILKNSARNMMVAQKIASDEIEEYGSNARDITSISELSNAITTAAKGVVDIEHSHENLQLAKEKLKLREKEVMIKSEGSGFEHTIDSIGVGSVKDMMKLLAVKKDIKNAKVKEDDLKE